MSGIEVAIWRELLSQFLLTFGLLSSVGICVWVVGAGWARLRRHRRRPASGPAAALAHRNPSPLGTHAHPLELFPSGGDVRGRLGTTETRARARGSQL